MNDSTLRKLAGAAVCLVAAIAAVISYEHVYHLAVTLGQPALAAWLMPLSVDGSIGAASAALLSAARLGHRSPRIGQTMLALGVRATLTANAYSGSAHGIAGMALAMWPGIALIGSTETALSMVRRIAGKPVGVPVPASGYDSRTAIARGPAGSAKRAPHQAVTNTRTQVTPDTPGVAHTNQPGSGRIMERTRTAPVRRTRAASAKRTRTAPVTNESAALRYASEIAAGNVPSMRKVRADLRVGQAKAQQIVSHLKSLNAEGIAA